MNILVRKLTRQEEFDLVNFIEARWTEDEHAARSARALTDIAAKREMLRRLGEIAAAFGSHNMGGSDTCLHIIAGFAAAYADHPDYPKSGWLK